MCWFDCSCFLSFMIYLLVKFCILLYSCWSIFIFRLFMFYICWLRFLIQFCIHLPLAADVLVCLFMFSIFYDLVFRQFLYSALQLLSIFIFGCSCFTLAGYVCNTILYISATCCWCVSLFVHVFYLLWFIFRQILHSALQLLVHFHFRLFMFYICWLRL